MINKCLPSQLEKPNVVLHFIRSIESEEPPVLNILRLSLVTEIAYCGGITEAGSFGFLISFIYCLYLWREIKVWVGILRAIFDIDRGLI
jgi:hypothetical protein